MDKQAIITILENSKDALLERFNISKIGLFGSYSQDRQHSESDVDILYELVEGNTLGLLEIEELEAFIKEILSIEQIDLVDKRYINPVIELAIEEELVYV